MSIPEQDKLLKKLQTLRESDLARRFVLPLLTTYSFDSIELRHGSQEKGVDILCLKNDEIAELDILAIQVKRLQFSGAASKPGHLHGVINQLSQCIDEPIKLKDGTQRCANRIWLISPYTLHSTALEQAFSKYAQSKTNRIQIVDGERLIRLMRDRAPELLAELGDPFAAYICAVRDEVAQLKEASALRINEKVSLLPIYVNVDVSLLSDKLASILAQPIKAGQRKEADQAMLEQDIHDLADFNARSHDILGVSPIDFEVSPVPKEQLAADLTAIQTSDLERLTGPRKPRNAKDDTKTPVHLRFEEAAFRQAIKTTTQRKLAVLKRRLAKKSATPGDPIIHFYQFVRSLEEFIDFRVLRRLIASPPYTLRPSLQYERTSVNLDAILDSRLNFQIVGDAGTGKTTLLRLLALTQLAQGDRIPIFVPLSTMTPQHTLLGITHQACKSSRYSGSKESLEKLMTSGEILLLLDGLDEAIRRVPDIPDLIHDFLNQFPKTQVVITTRPWAAIRTTAMGFTVTILPFTPQQTEQFFTNWFRDRPDLSQLMIRHIKKNPNLSDAAATPLLASVLAVVLSIGGKLPTSLLGLYDERFRLLLHDWDAVKGVRRDQFDVADKQFFLSKLAFQLHSKGIRSTSWEDMAALLRSNVGAIKDTEQANAFLIELIRNNNVIFPEINNKWSFGHLQYQEYLAALELKGNRRIKLQNYLGSGWWSNVLLMYADMTRDITHIFDSLIEKYGPTWLTGHPEIATQLYDLLQAAPNTDPSVQQTIQKEREFAVAVERSFEKYSDHEIITGKGRPH
jgi:hypothetical protein